MVLYTFEQSIGDFVIIRGGSVWMLFGCTVIPPVQSFGERRVMMPEHSSIPTSLYLVFCLCLFISFSGGSCCCWNADYRLGSNSSVDNLPVISLYDLVMGHILIRVPVWSHTVVFLAVQGCCKASHQHVLGLTTVTMMQDLREPASILDQRLVRGLLYVMGDVCASHFHGVIRGVVIREIIIQLLRGS